MNRRAEILLELIKFETPAGPLINELQGFCWDWINEEPLVRITKDHLLRVIDRFLADELTAVQLQEWAENLECREDVGFDQKQEAVLEEVFFESPHRLSTNH